MLPLLLADCRIQPFLASKRYIDFRREEDYATGLDQLLERIGVATEPSPVLSADAAASVLREFTGAYDLPMRSIDSADSRFGTQAFKMRLGDGKSVLYCHASGPLRGRVFKVQNGIGWYYEYDLGGSDSPLGLPTSHEERRDATGAQINFFEGGYISWTPAGSMAKAVTNSSGAEVVIGERAL